MANPLIETKLHTPSPRRNLVTWRRLHARLSSAPVAWVSLDERDNDPTAPVASPAIAA
jgi:hypothetical protein